MIEAYPLQWPVGYPRTVVRQSGKFKLDFQASLKLVRKEVERLKGTGIIISTNHPLLSSTGLPNGAARVMDPGVAVYFTFRDQQVSFACDRYYDTKDNITAIGRTIENIRGIERWGVSDMLKRMFTGFAALPNASTNIERPWHEVLGVPQSTSFEIVTIVWKELRKNAHPDRGGSEDRFVEIDEAYERAKKQFNK
jgi:hypothetical protein